MKIKLIGKVTKRICPTCKKKARITITRTGDGWERWQCEKNGCINEYQIYGRVN